MRRTIRLLLAAATLAVVATGAAGAGGLSGRFTSTLAYGLDSRGDLRERDLLFDLEGKHEWAHGWAVRALGRARFEDRLAPEARRELDLRELVVSKRASSYTLNLGRQQVVWGKADGLRLLDVVNPLDLREFLFDDYTDSRIPLWMANAELFRGDQSFQLLVIPDLGFDRPAPPGGEFFAAPELLAQPLPLRFERLRRPADRPRNWEYGARWATLLGPLELTVNAFYGWNNQPQNDLRLTAEGLAVVPRAVRSRLLGASGDLPIGPTVLRFEATFTADDRLPIATPDGLGGFVRQRVWRHVLGLDWIHRNWLISPQWFEERVLDPDPRLAGGRRRTFLTLLVRRTFHQDRLTVQLFSVAGLEHGDRWIEPRLAYQFFGRLELAVGGDLLGGDAAGIFGRFSRRDRVTFETTVRF